MIGENNIRKYNQRKGIQKVSATNLAGGMNITNCMLSLSSNRKKNISKNIHAWKEATSKQT